MATAVPVRKSAGPSVAVVATLTVALIMGSATMVSLINPPFLSSLSETYPEVRAAVYRLTGWPRHTLKWAAGLIPGESVPDRPDPGQIILQTPGLPETSGVDTPDSPMADALNPPSAPSMPPDIPDSTDAANEVGMEPERSLTPAQLQEIRQLLRESKLAYEEHRLDDAERKLRRIIDLNPNIPIAYHLLGTVLMERKDPDAALRVFEEASRKFPDYPPLHYDLGFLYFKQGVVSLANDELQKALSLNPHAPMAERARMVMREIRQSPPDRPVEVPPSKAPAGSE